MYAPHTERDIAQMLEVVGVKSLDELLRVPDAIALKEKLDSRSRAAGISDRPPFRTLRQKNTGVEYPFLPRRRRLSALRAAGDRGAGDARRVPYRIYAVPGRGLARLPPGDLRVADLHLPAHRHGDRQRFGVRRRDGARRGRDHGARRDRAGRKCSSRAPSHPNYRAVLRTYCDGLDVAVDEIPFDDERHDRSASAAAMRLRAKEYAAVALQSPNFFGNVDTLVAEALARVRRERHRFRSPSSPRRSRWRRSRPPASWGAQIVVGEAQSFGVAQAYGGPYAGFIASTQEHMRRIPGRLVGRTVDNARPHRVRADAASARAAHPPRARDLEHLHESGALRADRHDLSRAHGEDRPARRRRAQSRAIARAGQRRRERRRRSSEAFARRSSTSSSPTSGARRPSVLDELAGTRDPGRHRSRPVLSRARDLHPDDRDGADDHGRHQRARLRARRGAACPTQNVCQPLIFELGQDGRANRYLEEGKPLDSVLAERRRCATICRCPTTASSTCVRHYTRAIASHVRHRSGILSARLVHDEVQSAHQRCDRGAARVRRAASVHARRAGAGRAAGDVRARTTLELALRHGGLLAQSVGRRARRARRAADREEILQRARRDAAR